MGAAPELSALMRAVVREMAERGYAKNYRRAIIEGLDTSPAARRQRAAEQGFEPGWFHSSLRDLLHFDPTAKFYGRHDTGISLADSPQISNLYLDRFGERDYRGEPFTKNVLALMAAPGKVKGTVFNPPTHPYFGFPVREGYKPQFAEEGYDSMAVQDFIRHVQDPGVNRTSIRHTNADDDDAIPYVELILHNPSRVRSVNAMFNPRRTNKRDILAGIGGGAGLMAALNAALNDDEPRVT